VTRDGAESAPGMTPERRQLIEETLGRAPQHVVEIDEGYDFEVAIVDDEWVFRFPRRENVVEALEAEAVFLPRLAAALPVDVPRFEHVSHEPSFVAYALIRGTPLVGEDPDGVRAFLAALHAFDPAGLPIERPDWRERFHEQCARLERDVLPLVDPADRPRALALFAEVETLTGFEPVFIHNDLSAPHLLIRDGKLAGVIDWGDVAVGDPARDYAWLLNVAFPEWNVPDELRRRALFYHRLIPWLEAHYGVFTQQPARVERALREISSRL
jgi:aminoglycoside phosphotransferase (APT) family kinase protein